MRLGIPLLLALTAILVLPAAAAQDQSGPVQVKAGILVISFGNYDVNKGTYTLDFYLFFRWDPSKAPAGFTPEKFEFMNGRAAAKDKIYDSINNDTGEREIWYRIQANLYSEPHFDKYPFDSQDIQILFEDSVYTKDQLEYVPLQNDSGLDEGFRAQGWDVSAPVYDVVAKDYKFNETYSRARFTVQLSRERLSTAIKTILPPIAFCLVSAISFFIHPSKWTNRLGLGTSMVISAVMFHISQTLPLPPLAKLIFFDKLMLAAYAFLVASLIVTALIAINEDYWKKTDRSARLNAVGAILTLFSPLVVLAALVYL